MCSPHLRKGELHSTSLKTNHLNKLFEIHLHGKFVYSFHYSITYLYQYGLLNFILWVVTQYFFIFLLKFFQFGPLGTLFFFFF